MNITFKKILILIMVFFVILSLNICISAEPAELVVYVSPSGRDNASGSLNDPIKTLKAAKSKAMSLKSVHTEDITVYFKSGTYQFSDTEVFNRDSNPREGQTITYKAMPNNEVFFTGGNNIPAEAFTPVINPLIKERLYENVRNKVIQVNLNKLGISDFGAIYRSNPYTKELPDTTALYVDGIKQTLARWPNNEYAVTGTVLTSSRGENGEGGIFQYNENIPDRWKKADDVWLHGFWAWDWYDDSLKVEKLDIAKREFTLLQNTSFGMAKGKRYYAFNLLEEIDSPGEWYLERSTGILYYYPSVDLKGQKIQLSSLNKEIIRFENSKNIVIEDIIFENSCFSGININNSENIIIRGCTFRNLGGQGVNIKDGKDCGVVGSDFYDLGKGGVYMYGGDRITLTSSGHYVENCYFTRFALSIKTYVPAVHMEGVGHRISNCVIHDGPHSGITSNGNDFIIENTEIYDVCKETSDAGAVYTGRDWTRQGAIFRNNVVHDVYGVDGHGAHSFYFDDSDSGTTVINNTFYNVATPVFIHGGRDFVIENNTVVNSINSITIINLSKRRSDIDNDESFALMANYLLMPVKSDIWQKRYPTLANLLNEQYEYPLYNRITNTLTYNSKDVTYPDTALSTGTFENNITFEKEKILPFKDPENNNYELTEEIKELPGFVSTDYSKVGLKIDENRRKMPEATNFNLIYPKNGTSNVVGNKLDLSWQPTVGATKYKVTVSKDKNFRNIVFLDEVINTTVRINGLSYGGAKYYWKVEAIGTSQALAFRVNNTDGAASFKTSLKEILEKEEFNKVLDKAAILLENAKIGDEVGDYSEAEGQKFRETVEAAQALAANKDISQVLLDNATENLILGIKNYEASRKSGLVSMGGLIKNYVNWKADNANFLRLYGDTLNFAPTPGGGIVAGYQEILPSYPIWTFKAKFDVTANWQGFGLRASDATSVGWSAAASYMIIVKAEQIELQRFYLGGKDLGVVPNTFIKSGEEHKIEIGSVDIPGGGVNLIFRVDGQTVFDYEDKEGYIPDSGLLTIYGSTNRVLSLTAE